MCDKFVTIADRIRTISVPYLELNLVCQDPSKPFNMRPSLSFNVQLWLWWWHNFWLSWT